MSLSRIVRPAVRVRWTVLPLQTLRLSSTQPASAASTPSAPQRELPPEEMDNPSLLQKIKLRFKGIPLKGEPHPPRSLFDDVDKEWFAPQSLPLVPKDFKEYPERDIKNYPYPARRMYPPKTRMLMIPDSWMTPFYKVTGVSGPYLFFGGIVAFLFNKEYIVFDENASMIPGWILAYLFLTRAFGYRLDNYLYQKHKAEVDQWKSLIEEDLKEAKEFRKAAAEESTALQAIKENFPQAFKENMHMQLEAAYRANMQNLAAEVKRRINYLQETEATRHRFERDHMLNWIMQSVRAEINANKDGIKDQYLNNCIEQLKALSVSASR